MRIVFESIKKSFISLLFFYIEYLNSFIADYLFLEHSLKVINKFNISSLNVLSRFINSLLFNSNLHIFVAIYYTRIKKNHVSIPLNTAIGRLLVLRFRSFSSWSIVQGTSLSYGSECVAKPVQLHQNRQSDGPIGFTCSRCIIFIIQLSSLSSQTLKFKSTCQYRRVRLFLMLPTKSNGRAQLKRDAIQGARVTIYFFHAVPGKHLVLIQIHHGTLL